MKDIEAMCQRGIEEIEAVLLEKEQRYCVNLEKVKKYYKKEQQEVGARPDSGSCTHDEVGVFMCVCVCLCLPHSRFHNRRLKGCALVGWLETRSKRRR